MKQERKILPPIYFFGSLILTFCLHFVVPAGRFLHASIRYLGVIPIFVGTVFIFWTAYMFKKADTTIKPFQESSQLLREGLYRISRNPIYLGMVLILTGITVYLGNAVPFVIIPVFIRLIERNFILVEEQMLEETFKEEYREYKNRVRRWL